MVAPPHNIHTVVCGSRPRKTLPTAPRCKCFVHNRETEDKVPFHPSPKGRMFAPASSLLGRIARLRGASGTSDRHPGSSWIVPLPRTRDASTTRSAGGRWCEHNKQQTTHSPTLSLTCWGPSPTPPRYRPSSNGFSVSARTQHLSKLTQHPIALLVALPPCLLAPVPSPAPPISGQPRRLQPLHTG